MSAAHYIHIAIQYLGESTLPFILKIYRVQFPLRIREALV